MSTYFGFGIAPSMFPDSCGIVRQPLSLKDVQVAVTMGVISCLNPSHQTTINVMEERFGLVVHIPERAPVVLLKPGDAIIVMGVSGLPRLEGRHEYTDKEIAAAKFTFSRFAVL